MLAVWGSVAEDTLDVPGVVGGDDFFGYDFLCCETGWLLGGFIEGVEVLEVLQRTVVVVNGDLLGLGNDFSVDETSVQIQAYPDVAGSQCFGAREG